MNLPKNCGTIFTLVTQKTQKAQKARKAQIGVKAENMPSDNLPNQTEQKKKAKRFGSFKNSSYLCRRKEDDSSR